MSFIISEFCADKKLHAFIEDKPELDLYDITLYPVGDNKEETSINKELVTSGHAVAESTDTDPSGKIYS